MNRWWGSSADSDKQSSERDSRAARRTLRTFPQIPSDSSEDEFNDCDTSLLFSGDGQNDLVESDDDMDQQAAAAAAKLARQKALPVDQADFENDPDSWKKELKLKFDKSDVKYWFNAIEAQMKKYGINRQWDKKNAVAEMLPADVTEEMKPILRLTEDEAGDHVYKDLKDEILTQFGPKEEDAYKQAKALKMTGTPSALGKKLIHLICPGAKPFSTCHCARIVFGMWEEHLSAPIKSKLAGQVFNKDTYVEMFRQADQVFHANGGSRVHQPAVVAAVTPTPQTSSEDVPQVAAAARGGRGRGGRGGRGRGGRGGSRGNLNNTSNENSAQNQGQDSNNKPHQKGQKHPDLPASAGWACAQHWKRGQGAPYCSDPLVCKWVSIVAPRT